MQNQRNEFNDYIKEYRKNQSNDLWLSEKTSGFPNITAFSLSLLKSPIALNDG